MRCKLRNGTFTGLVIEGMAREVYFMHKKLEDALEIKKDA